MKSPVEIAAMPLIERQILVADLRNVPATDKLYAVALQLIAAATSKKDWQEPALIEVKNIAGHDLTVDKTKIGKDGTAKIFPWQFLAVRRFVEPADEDAANAAIKPLLRIPSKDEGMKPITRDEILGMIKESKSGLSAVDIAKLVSQTVLETLTKAGIKVAALILFAFLFCFADRASAQVQSYAVGSTPGLYHSYYIAGLNGGTNAWTGTESFTNPTVSSIMVTNPNWVVVNGQPTNEYTTATQSTTNVPGLISLVNYDEAQIFLGFNVLGVVGPTVTSTWDYSPDGTSDWQLSALTIVCATNLYGAGTNYFFPIGTTPGYLRLNNITATGVGVISNVVVQVGLRPKRTGP